MKKAQDAITKTVQFKLFPDGITEKRIDYTSLEYIKTVNTLTHIQKDLNTAKRYSSKGIVAALPSTLKAQCATDASSIYRKNKNKKTFPVLKKPVLIYNNQGYRLDFERNLIKIPFWINGKSKQLSIPTHFSDFVYEDIHAAAKLGTLRITKKNGKYVAQLSLTMPVVTLKPINKDSIVMGVDSGIKNPAVVATSNGTVEFIGNGRENKVIRRKFNANRKALGKAKQKQKIKKINNKENRIMTDRDHKYSRQIVNHAIRENVSVIYLEKLTNIRKRTRKSRKNNHSLHTWSFYRLHQFIKYKAALAGIHVIDVNPAYTSQKCPNCKLNNKAKDRRYKCSCGYTDHRDILAARNIMSVAHGQL